MPGSWIHLQGKKLVRAEEQLEEQVRLVDREFDVFHGTGLKAGNDIKQKTIDFILGRDSCKEIPSPVVKIFTNIKFHSRIKYLNLHDINEKYTIRSIVCEASCHLVTRSHGHSVFNVATNKQTKGRTRNIRTSRSASQTINNIYS